MGASSSRTASIQLQEEEEEEQLQFDSPSSRTATTTSSSTTTTTTASACHVEDETIPPTRKHESVPAVTVEDERDDRGVGNHVALHLQQRRELHQQQQQQQHQLDDIQGPLKASSSSAAATTTTTTAAAAPLSPASPPKHECSGTWLLNDDHHHVGVGAGEGKSSRRRHLPPPINTSTSNSQEGEDEQQQQQQQTHSPIMTLSASSGSLLSNDTIVFSFVSDDDDDTIGLFLDDDDESYEDEKEVGEDFLDARDKDDCPSSDQEQVSVLTTPTLSIHLRTTSSQGAATTSDSSRQQRQETDFSSLNDAVEDERPIMFHLSRTQSFDDDDDNNGEEVVDSQGQQEQLQLRIPSWSASSSMNSLTRYYQGETLTTAASTSTSKSNNGQQQQQQQQEQNLVGGGDQPFLERSSPHHRHRIVDVYQTDRTMLIQPSLDSADGDQQEGAATSQDNEKGWPLQQQQRAQQPQPLMIPFRTCARATCNYCCRKIKEGSSGNCCAAAAASATQGHRNMATTSSEGNNNSNKKGDVVDRTYGGPIGDWDIRPPLPKSTSSSSSSVAVQQNSSSPFSAKFIRLPSPPPPILSVPGTPPQLRGNRERGFSEDFSVDDITTATTTFTSSGDEKENHHHRRHASSNSSSRRCTLPPAKNLFRQSSSGAMTETSCSSGGSSTGSAFGGSIADSQNHRGFQRLSTTSSERSPYSQYHKRRSRSEDYVDVPSSASRNNFLSPRTRRRSMSPSSVATDLPPSLPKLPPQQRESDGNKRSSSYPVLPSGFDDSPAPPRARASSCDGFRTVVESSAPRTRCRSEDVIDDTAFTKMESGSTFSPFLVASSRQLSSGDKSGEIPAPACTPPRRHHVHDGPIKLSNKKCHAFSTPTNSAKLQTIATTPSSSSRRKGNKEYSPSYLQNSPMGVADEFWKSAQQHPREDVFHQDSAKEDKHIATRTSLARPSTRTSSLALVNYGKELERKGQLELALQTYRQSVGCLKQERVYQRGPADVVYHKYQWTCSKVYNKIATVHFKMGNYRQSLSVLNHCLELTQLSIGCLSFDDAVSSLLEYQRGEWQGRYLHDYEQRDAIPLLLLQQLEFLKAGDVLEWIGELLISKGRVYHSLGITRECKRWLKRAISILQEVKPEQGPSITTRAGSDPRKHPHSANLLLAMAMVDMGRAFERSNRFHDAMTHYQHALHLQRCFLGDNHLHVATTLGCIGSIHIRYGYFGPSMSCYMESLRIYRLWMGDVPSSAFVSLSSPRRPRPQLSSSPVDIGVALASIGWIHYMCGDISGAMKASTDALTIVQGLLGAEHRNTASIQYQIGLIQIRQGRGKEASKMLKAALRTQLAVLGDDHEDVPLTLDAIATAYEQQHRWNKAITYLERVLGSQARKKASSSRGHHSPSSSTDRQHQRYAEEIQLALTYSRLGNLYGVSSPDNVGLARECWSKALHLHKRNHTPPNDWRVLQLQHAIRTHPPSPK